MRHQSNSETIAAIITPPGVGGVGIIRLSGLKSREIIRNLFVSGRPNFQDFKPYHLHHGWILDAEGRRLDEVLVSFMPGPTSYTGEDVVEVNCHGGSALLRAVLDSTLSFGARPARPGEFTLRAYLNGRMDLTQAEAVVEIINAPSKTGLLVAQKKLEGALSQHIVELRHLLEELRVQLCVAVDFPDDEIECLAPDVFFRQLEGVQKGIEAILANFERARFWREGALVVLAGRVNAGKSSLFNSLLGRSRAIVTPEPGTTRDYIEEHLDVQGIPVRLVDTAGIRQSLGEAERIGLEWSQELIDKADLVLLVYDGQLGLTDAEFGVANTLGPHRVLLIENKQDLKTDETCIAATHLPGFARSLVSATTGFGLGELIDQLAVRLEQGAGDQDFGGLVPNARQKQALEMASREILELSAELQAGVPYDVLGVRLETACQILREITGEMTPNAVLESIFSRFCIGK